MRRPLLTSLSLTLAVGCKPPPQAPQELEELCAYLFHHMADEPDEDGAMLEFEAGITNLDAWLNKGNNLENTLEGYQITALDSEAVDALGNQSARGVDELIGAAVAIDHPFGRKRMAFATVVADWARSRRPTSVEPVKVTFRTRSSVVSTSPTSAARLVGKTL